MQKPYGLVADVHCHKWAAFATTNPKTGINSRLETILSELERVAATTAAAGGDRVRIAGDLFHVRGAIHPSVFNPVKDALEDIAIKHHILWEIDPGNHDMELRESSRVGNAITSLESPNVEVITNPTELAANTIMVPWIEDSKRLIDELQGWAKLPNADKYDVLIHAPVRGVITGLDGIDSATLASLGFKRVFAGHYHNHKDFGNGVYSIGPIAPHTWSDVGIKAGFLVVHENRVDWHASHAPDFVDILPGMDEAEMALKADGNYVRVRTHSTKNSEINALREFFEKAGAKGVVIQYVKDPASTRTESTRLSAVTVGASLEASVGEYVQKSGLFTVREHADKVNVAAQKILAEASA